MGGMRTIAFFCLAVGFSSLPGQGWTRSAIDNACRTGIFPALADGGFLGSLDCRRDRLKVRKVGEIRTRQRAFQIYDYRYQLAPVCPECAVHHGQRIIIMSAGRYIGNYKPDTAQIRIRRNTLVLSPRPGTGGMFSRTVAVKFGPKGPPSRIWFDGAEVSLDR